MGGDSTGSDPGIRAMFFSSASEFENWLEANYERAPEALVGFKKRATGQPSLTWAESVDVALCFGWIDGIRRRIDDERYSIRFTPRRQGSIWSRVNIGRAEALREAGRMRPAGVAAFEGRDEAKTQLYSYEREKAVFPSELEALLRSNGDAWDFFEAQAPSYRRAVTWWVVSPKLEATRLRRLEKLIEASAAGRRLHQLDPGRQQ